MKWIYNKHNVTFRLVIIVCILLVSLVYVSFKTNVNVAEVFSQTKELPIYSVETEGDDVLFVERANELRYVARLST